MEYDFSGWATKSDLLCSDGRIIANDAFKKNDGTKVPLVWNHQHDDPEGILGHAILEHRDGGMYAYCKFNDTQSGQTAKRLVVNGDIDRLSIYANKLKSDMNKVVSGCIREVSLVLSGANPGAYIDSVVTHNSEGEEEEEMTIFTDENIEFPEESFDIEHSDKEKEMKNKNQKSIADIFDTLTEEQEQAVYTIIEQVLRENGIDEESLRQSDISEDKSDEESDEEHNEECENESDKDNEENNDKEGEEENMKHNVFNSNNKENIIMHSELISNAIADAKKYGSMKESFLAHAAAQSITDVAYLFPDAKELNTIPVSVKNDDSFVRAVIDGAKHTPFSRIKTTFANITADEARARGYTKGKEKNDNTLVLLKRSTTPTTIYVKNKMDRDDIIDIKDFNVVLWLKKEMREQLEREMAVAILLSDGRDLSNDDKINELNIRPIAKDDPFYAIPYVVTKNRDYNPAAANDSVNKGIIRSAIKARKEYKGSGKPTFFTTEAVLTDLLLIEDTNGRVIYESEEKLATALRVKNIVTVPEMEKHVDIYGIIVNMQDYTIGADKGGQVNMFDDFDIDYNQEKYLIETRVSGALTVPKSAIVLKKEIGG